MCDEGRRAAAAAAGRGEVDGTMGGKGPDQQKSDARGQLQPGTPSQTRHSPPPPFPACRKAPSLPDEAQPTSYLCLQAFVDDETGIGPVTYVLEDQTASSSIALQAR